MPVITLQNRRIELSRRENLLAALEKAGVGVPCSCNIGICHGCLAQASRGDVPAQAQQGLSAHQRKLNYLLTCQCFPDNDLELTLVGDLRGRHRATLIEKRTLNHRVMLARFAVDMDWRAGQYVTLWKSAMRGRVYSIASTPDEGFLELHLRRRPNGIISQWLDDELAIGEQCEISTAGGDCYYSPAMPGQPVLLAGTGTGLAPLYGIIKQALAERHHGDITLYAAAGEPGQLYMREELAAMSTAIDRFHFIPVVHRHADGDDGILQGDLADLIPQRHPQLRDHLVYLCGARAMVDSLQRQCFLNGARMENIFTDTFAPAI